MFPQINRQVKAALRWYAKEEQRTRYTINCRQDSELCPFALPINSREIPPFQFLAGIGTTYGTSAPASWQLLTLQGTVAVDLGDFVEELRVDQFTHPTREYITLERPLEHGENLPNGLYEMVIVTSGGERYYSETMVVCGEPEDMESCHYSLEWSSCGDVGTLHYDSTNFENIIYLDQGRVFLGVPQPQINESTEDGGDGSEVVVRTRKDVRWTMEIGGVPWYMADALSEVPLHERVSIRIPGETAFDQIHRVNVEVAWPEGETCTAMVTMTFQADEASVSNGCCTSFPRPCINPCITADGIWAVGDPLPSIGTVVLLPNGFYGTYYGLDQEIERVDQYGFGDKVRCTFASVSGEAVPRFYGSEWIPAVYFLDASSENCDGEIYVSANAMPGYAVQLQYTLNGTTWIDAGPLTNLGGQYVDVPVAAVSIRLRLMGEDCLIATSETQFNPCSPCSGSSVVHFTGIGSATVNDTEISVTSSTGYFSVQVGGVTTVFGDGNPVGTKTGVLEADDDTPREFCLYASDSEGNRSGSISLLDLDSEGVLDIQLGVQNSLESLFLGSNPITELDISTAKNNLFALGLDGCALTSVDQLYIELDVAGNFGGLVNTSGGTNADPTAASATAISNLGANGWTIFT